ncbi:hypothetical protein [Hyphomicrobium sp.]|uniref:hypothetical protein n=1 Tax=Hyphomicrobium sp. TaxID=82 RepID=UPI002E36854A|nr:hypothetical protein [Hyphomicrobium sp.]HEX2840276.1 hypothetical protein [Hyphomicrobium sp.]
MGRKMRITGVVAAGGLGLMLAVAAQALAPGWVGPVAAQETPPAPPNAEAAPSAAVPATCARSEFESAVDHAAEALRDLNNRNRPEFQAKLRKLKEKRAWNDDQFLKEAAPYVKDDQIAIYDAKTNDLLASISSMGQEGANAKDPNCTVLAELRGLMQVLIDTQGTKWTYMFKKLDDELAK